MPTKFLKQIVQKNGLSTLLNVIYQSTFISAPAKTDCKIENDKTDLTKANVMFLIDSSVKMGYEKFQGAVKLISDTVKEFRNIGPNGIQVQSVGKNEHKYSRKKWQ